MTLAKKYGIRNIYLCHWLLVVEKYFLVYTCFSLSARLWYKHLHILLSAEEQFSILGQWPHFIINYQFKFVDVVPDFFNIWQHKK